MFKDSTSDNTWVDAFDAFNRSRELLEATWECDENKIAENLEL